MNNFPKNLLRALAASVAALPVWAAAQTSVTAYGLLDLSVGRTQAPGAAAIKGVDNGKLTTSHIGFKGSEDLGDGLSAVFTLEHFLRADTGSAGRSDTDVFWARNAFVGLNGSFGAVQAGRLTTSLFVHTLRYNPFGDSYGFSPSIRHYFTSGTVTGDSGWSDALRYTSPNMGGATFSAELGAGEGNGGRNAGLSGQYVSGQLGLAAAWQKVEKGAAVADTTTWQLSGSYDLKLAKLFAQYGQVDNDSSGNAYKITGLGATIPVEAQGRVMLQWGRIQPKTGAKRSTLSMGYAHQLSKRTELYGAYMNDKLSDRAAGNSYSLGVRHRF